MRFTKALATYGLLSALFLSGCATNSGDRETMPEWVGDKVERDVPDADNADADSPADASSLFGFLSKEYLKKEDDGPILAIDPNKKQEDKESTELESKAADSETETAETGSSETTGDSAPDADKNTEAKPVEPVIVELTTNTADEPTKKAAINATDSKKVITAPVPAAPVIPKPKPMIAQSPAHEAQAKAARSQYQIGLAEMKSGNLVGALEIFKTLSQQYPLLSGPVVNQGIVLRKQGRLEEAKKVLQDALFRKFQNPYLLNELGAVNRELGHFKQAKQSYLTAIRIESAYGNAHYNLGVLADLYLHDPSLALKEFEIYQSLQEKPSKKVKGWIKELKRRIKRNNKRNNKQNNKANAKT